MVLNKLAPHSIKVLACLQECGKPMSAVSIRNATRLELRLVKDALYRLSINKQALACGKTRAGNRKYKVNE